VANNIGEAYSLEYTDIPKVFLAPHHLRHCCTNVIRGYCCATMCSNNDMFSVMQIAHPRRKTTTDRQTVMDGTVSSSSLTLEREEHLERQNDRSKQVVSRF
jgi:hypothetical protein